MPANGPAVCFGKRNPTTAPGNILVPCSSGAKKLSRYRILIAGRCACPTVRVSSSWFIYFF